LGAGLNTPGAGTLAQSLIHPQSPAVRVTWAAVGTQ